MDQEIVNYILQAQKHGLSDLEIKQNLLDAGWDAATVEQSFVFAKAADSHSGTGGSLTSPAGYPSFQRPDLSRQPAAFQNTHTTIAISEQSFRQKSPRRPFFKNKVFWLVLVLLLVLSASAFGYYKYIYATPETVFNKFLAVKRPAVFTSDYSLGYSYTDASSTQPVTLSLSGTAYNNGINASSSESSNTFSFALKSPAVSAGVNLQYLFINNILYFDISQVAELKSLGADWVKIDTNKALSSLNANSTTTGQSLNSLLENGGLKTKIQNLIDKAKIINLGDSLTKETVKNVPVYHLTVTLDSQALVNTALDIIDLIQNDPNFTGEKITDAQKNQISSILKKFTLKEGGLWIGQKDSQLYQMHFVLSVPSAQDLDKLNAADLIPVINEARIKARDAKRLNDARQIATALELFYNDHGGYPEGVAGVPNGLVPKYISVWPAIPTPFDGTCTNYFNSYWYKNVGTGFTKNGIKLYPSFTFTFCLGQATGGYGAGIGMVTPKGLAGNVPCPGPLDKCVNKNPDRFGDFEAQIDKLQFNSSLVFDDTFYNFGKTQTLEIPKNPLDLMQSLQSLLGSQPSSSSTNQTLTQ